MKPKDVCLIGCGDIGTGLALQLRERGHRPLALRRNTGALPAELPSLSLDYSEPSQLQQLNDVACDVAVLTPTPAGRGEAGYRAGYLQPVENLLAQWQQQAPRDILYVSSTRVYGDRGGDWVDESSALQPDDACAEILCETEARLRDSHHRVTIVRFAGIYGRWPSRLLQRIAAGEICQAQPPRFSNRIHRLDCIGFLDHLIDLPDRGPLYLGVDDEPALQFEVESWLAAQLGVAEPRATAPLMSANRRCRNELLRQTGYRLRYPDYRAGYSAMMSSTSIATALGKAAT
ncbi:MAG: SDR family NAD(P)-dependent oxidoreductase [Halieaceae bacterium]